MSSRIASNSSGALLYLSKLNRPDAGDSPSRSRAHATPE